MAAAQRHDRGRGDDERRLAACTASPAAYVTDVTTASRTLLLDLERARGRTRPAPPSASTLRTSRSVVGTAEEIGPTDAFGPSLRLTGLSVDQQAALVGEHCLEPGESKCTYGTGAFLLANAGPRPITSSGGLAVSVAWQLGDAGRATASTGRSMPPARPSPGCSAGVSSAGPRISTPSPARCPTAAGVTVVPALSGLGAPWWRPDALASIEGIGPASEPAHVVRATVEGLAAQVTLLARAAAIDLGRPLALLRVDGGLTRSRVLMQMQADLLQVPVEVAASPHATAAGVGALARLGAGAGRDAV